MSVDKWCAGLTSSIADSGLGAAVLFAGAGNRCFVHDTVLGEVALDLLVLVALVVVRFVEADEVPALVLDAFSGEVADGFQGYCPPSAAEIVFDDFPVAMPTE